ncbi:hypothetical protein [Halostagnicola sp. A-GB9-2]|uniref:hypothetical protein n=1 Tax=Halostagnicola sp. A-GB9-2 TaxID=3048066 RepID=UPI0024BF1AF5|nr:hypothetical protein [Halostagnicola sp. A-GB9-2]MDJ1433852.1 hypothetical protein [Halostagnicola sp. A-GB9-2]
MGPIERLEEEFLDVSSSRADIRELLELVAGSILFLGVAYGLTAVLIGRTEALVVTGVLGAIFAITILSQAYWAIAGRDDYRDGKDR